MKEVILVSAEWCAACKPPKTWWDDLNGKVGGVKFRVAHAESPEFETESITTLPCVLFKEDGGTLAKRDGVLTEAQVIRWAQALWGYNPDLACSKEHTC